MVKCPVCVKVPEKERESSTTVSHTSQRKVISTTFLRLRSTKWTKLSRYGRTGVQLEMNFEKSETFSEISKHPWRGVCGTLVVTERILVSGRAGLTKIYSNK